MTEMVKETLMRNHRLMIPGPVDIADDVRQAMAGPAVPHYGDDWIAVYGETVDLLRQVFQTRGDLHLLAGPGTAGLGAALGSLLRTGEMVLIPFNGFFGKRMASVARCYGLHVVPLAFPAGEPLDPDLVREALDQAPDVEVIAVVHHETSTGVLNPVREIASLAGARGIPIVVDAVASLGGVPLAVDEWGLDVVVTVANKCLAAPPGLAPVSVSSRAWEVMASKPDRAHGWYLNLETWKEYAEKWADWHPFPTTLPTQNVLALRTALRDILAKGLDAYWGEHSEAAARVRRGLRELGFQLFVEGEYACPLITVVKGQPSFEVGDLMAYLYGEHGIKVSGGIGELSGKIFRVGHMGKATSKEYTDAFLTAVRSFLERES
jgi:alanine-glyoxylate transaminase/serine-glyoxylate transaminase/serine-pyruvate transaminase